MKTTTHKSLLALARLPMIIAAVTLSLAFSGTAKADPYITGSLNFNLTTLVPAPNLGGDPSAGTGFFTMGGNTITAQIVGGSLQVSPSGDFSTLAGDLLTFNPAELTGLGAAGNPSSYDITNYIEFGPSSDPDEFTFTLTEAHIDGFGTGTPTLSGQGTVSGPGFATTGASFSITDSSSVDGFAVYTGSFSATPEPSSWVLGLLVLGTLGYLLRVRIVRSLGLDQVESADLAV
ncbi:MAG TPA: PEP-CTERM sorting domain-containing protein [Candidatus Methylacidiphilales bacterium]